MTKTQWETIGFLIDMTMAMCSCYGIKRIFIANRSCCSIFIPSCGEWGIFGLLVFICAGLKQMKTLNGFFTGDTQLKVS